MNEWAAEDSGVPDGPCRPRSNHPKSRPTGFNGGCHAGFLLNERLGRRRGTPNDAPALPAAGAHSRGRPVQRPSVRAVSIKWSRG